MGLQCPSCRAPANRGVIMLVDGELEAREMEEMGQERKESKMDELSGLYQMVSALVIDAVPTRNAHGPQRRWQQQEQKSRSLHRSFSTGV